MTQLTLNKAETIKLSFTFCVLLGLGLGPIGSSNTVQFEPENIHRWGKYPYMAGLQFYYFGFNWFTGAQKQLIFCRSTPVLLNVRPVANLINIYARKL